VFGLKQHSDSDNQNLACIQNKKSSSARSQISAIRVVLILVVVYLPESACSAVVTSLCRTFVLAWDKQNNPIVFCFSHPLNSFVW